MSRMTFHQLISEYDIEMPIIQRGYVQGANDSKTEDIRENFIETLLSSLEDSENKKLHLNFIYGKVEEEQHFIPLDGQQRLTTLFLLHWYIAQYSGNHEQLKGTLSYFTQPSSKDFCTALGAAGEVLNGKKPSDSIKQAPWFFKRWEKDATVSGMLTTLNAIHKQLMKSIQDKSKAYWCLLTNEDECPITFDFLDLEQQQLTDELYIKMNARGLVLTEFEQFKAWLIEYLKSHHQHQVNDITQKLDGAWIDLFWEYRSPEPVQQVDIDTPYMRFFRNYFQLLYLSSKEEKDLETVKELAPVNKDEYPFFSTKNYEQILNAFQDKVPEVFEALDKLQGLQENKTLDKDFDVEFFVDEPDLFKGFIAQKSTYKQRFLFYAFIKAKLANKNDNLLKSWMRVMRNLAENISFGNLGEFRLRIKLINKLLEETLEGKDSAEAFYKALCDYEDNKLNQVQEEKNKAELIVEDKEWEKIFLTYENNSYFRGQIQFLLDFMESEKASQSKQKTFEYYGRRCVHMFSTEKDSFIEETGKPAFLLNRAMLLIALQEEKESLYPVKIGQNHSLLESKDWRNRVLGHKDRRLLLKSLIDTVERENERSDTNTLHELKCAFINWINKEKGKIKENWRGKLVYYPEIIEMAKHRLIRRDPRDFLVLKNKTKGGTKYPLHGYALYKALEKRKNDLLCDISVKYKGWRRNDTLTFTDIDKIKYGHEEHYSIRIEYDGREDKGYIIYITRAEKGENLDEKILVYVEDHLNFKPFPFNKQQKEHKIKHRDVQDECIRYRYKLGKSQEQAEEKLIELCNWMTEQNGESNQ